MTKKAIFIDIDDTLLPDDRFPPCDRDINALRKARENGHYVIINTGRSQGILPEVLKNADYIDGFLCGCGTHFVLGGKVIFTQSVPHEALRGLVRYYLNNCTERCGFEGVEDLFDIRPIPRFKAKVITSEDDFDTIYAGQKITKLTIMGPLNPEEIPIVSPYFDIFELTRWHELILHGNNKGTGLKKACEYLNIPVEDSVAIGDSRNDFEMFDAAGFSVAMGDAEEAAKKRADYISVPCREGGVADALEHLKLI